jgi:hypothetical protein
VEGQGRRARSQKFNRIDVGRFCFWKELEAQEAHTESNQPIAQYRDHSLLFKPQRIRLSSSNLVDRTY